MSCTRASKFLDVHSIEPKEVVSASRKLDAKAAAELAAAATRVIVAKGSKVQTFSPHGKPGKDVIDAMLGPTGNLRAPCIRAGKTLLIGFNEDAYRDALL
jgi:arsenate reductase-like glutaredoxin family protein